MIQQLARSAVATTCRFVTDDHYQVALIAAWEALRTWEPGLGRSQRSWCQMKAHYAILDYMRDEYRQRGVAPAAELPDVPVLDPPVIHLEDVVRVVKPVSERDWRIIEERLSEKTDVEIADSMGIERSRVYQLGVRMSRRMERCSM